MQETEPVDDNVRVTVQDHGNTSSCIEFPLALSVGQERGQIKERRPACHRRHRGGLAWAQCSALVSGFLRRRTARYVP